MSNDLSILEGLFNATDNEQLDSLTLYERALYKWQPRQTLRILPPLPAMSVDDIAKRLGNLQMFGKRATAVEAVLNRLLELASAAGGVIAAEPMLHEVFVHNIETGNGKDRKFVSFRCTHSPATACVGCQIIQACQPRVQTQAEAAFFGEMAPRKEIAVRVFPRAALREGELPTVKWAKLPNAVTVAIKTTAATTDRTGRNIDITNPISGIDFDIVREGNDRNSKYHAQASTFGQSPMLFTVVGDKLIPDQIAIAELLLSARLLAPITDAYPTLPLVQQSMLIESKLEMNAQAMLAGDLANAFTVQKSGGFGGGGGRPQQGLPGGFGGGVNPYGAALPPAGGMPGGAPQQGMGNFNRRYDVTDG